jgi:class 3 adenylate cyclase
MMSEQWSLFIDIEGFSALWEHEVKVRLALGELMPGVFRVGQLCFPRDPERLFAYQAGDGFLIVSDFHEPSLDRCVSVAVALMRHVAGARGRFTRCSIAEGDLADITARHSRNQTMMAFLLS